MADPEVVVHGRPFQTVAGTAVQARRWIEPERLDPGEISTAEGLTRGILRYLRNIWRGQRTFIQYDHIEALTVSTTALKLSFPGTADYAIITVETAAVRFWFTQAPTATVGHAAEAGDTIILNSYFEVQNFRVIRRDAADATIQVSYGNVQSVN